MKYLVCYSGGHSSALAAVETVRRYGKENVILLNHDISEKVEHPDVKRFKQEVADYLGVPITYANAVGLKELTPFEAARSQRVISFGFLRESCTFVLKSEPFKRYLSEHFPVAEGKVNRDVCIIYGFSKDEVDRAERRKRILAKHGYMTDFPLINWERTIYDIEEIGIKKPVVYEYFTHANCIGCLKGRRQHWYAVYYLYPDIFEEAKELEKEIGHGIISVHFLEEFEPKFKAMKDLGIKPSTVDARRFWADVRKKLKEHGMVF